MVDNRIGDDIPLWLVYVAGPLGQEPDWQANTGRAIEAADALMASEPSIVCYVPHALGPRWQATKAHPYEWWIRHGLAMVLRSHAVLRIPGDSPGADREVGLARKVRLPVFERAEALLEWVREKDGR